ncbi:hypothetical protein BW730_08575 [Tessaracoccus aquimaris]|uniref:PknH-like extracellular domain-containing protein n=1 Tax=Tessaracoccus aquimaris TaxID=1332264 RepID=A0A1Q2CN49_9ACTN|nr:hypothetical protein [Tessaracoccus aquimaris]AQP47536.1 hypothetical protein BW730_08575 [Tessaracoccus aquimaris]
MTPMNEPELRRELSQIDVPTPIDNASLAASVIGRGRGIKRRRGAIAAVVALAVVAGGVGVGIATLPRRDALPAEPTPTPSITVVPTPSASAPPEVTPTAQPPAPVWTDLEHLPDNVGSLGDRGLPLDPRVGESSDEGSVEHATMQLMCQQVAFRLEALGTITGGRTIVDSAPTSAQWQSILVFGSEQDAADFMAQARGKAQECMAAGTTPAEPVEGVEDMFNRSVPVYHDDETLGTDGVIFGSYAEVSNDGGTTFAPAPDAVITYVAREANVVAVAQLGGEGAGDMSTEPGIDDELRTVIGQILAK